MRLIFGYTIDLQHSDTQCEVQTGRTTEIKRNTEYFALRTQHSYSRVMG